MQYIEELGKLGLIITIKFWKFFTSLFFHWTSVIFIISILFIIFSYKLLNKKDFNSKLKTDEDYQNDEVQKIEIIKQPKQKNWPAWLLFIIAIITTLWSIYTYNQLLPLNQSNLVFSEKDIQIAPCQCNNNTINCFVSKDFNCDVIQSKIGNVGKLEAKNLKFKIYGFIANFQPDGKIDNLIYKQNIWDDYIIHKNIDPGSSISFGTIYQDYIYRDDKENDINILHKKMLLIYHLKYTDNTLSNKDEFDKIYFYQYQIGNPFITSLVGDEYKKYYEDLKRNFSDKDSNLYDPDILDYLLKNPPINKQN